MSCDYGYEDCKTCHPKNFKNGYYFFQTCRECQCECNLDEINDDGICNDCKCQKWLEENGISHADAEILIELLKYAEFVGKDEKEFVYQSEG